MSLIEQLKQIPDPRSGHGKRYPLWWLLWIMLVGNLCGYRGYRPLADFCAVYWEPLAQWSGTAGQYGCPCFSTLRRLMQQVDFNSVAQVFNQWCEQWMRPTLAQWVGGDGKSIRATRRDAQGANFVTTVTLFTHTPGTVVAFAVMENAKTSEIVVIRALIRQLAECPGIVFTLDALHCQKATVQLIIQQQQHYLIAVKGNQKYLWKTLTAWVTQAPPLSVAQHQDCSHGRQVTRTVTVYATPATLTAHWLDCRRLVWVERRGIRAGHAFCTHSAYMTDLVLSADELLHPIQNRWSIENQLHWVRDVTFSEDDAPRRGGHAPVNWSILNCWLMNVVRQLGCRTVPQGMRLLSNQVQKVCHILLHGFSSA
jgi:predicted transposase YbfD/YdcC